MEWAVWLLLIPGAWIVWQIAKVAVGLFTPAHFQARGAIIHFLKQQGISAEMVGEDALTILARRAADLARLSAYGSGRSRAEELWNMSQYQALCVAKAVWPHLRSPFDQEEDFTQTLEILHISRSPLINHVASSSADPNTE